MKNKNSFDIVKIKGLIGIFLLLVLLIAGKSARFFDLSSDERYWGGLIWMLFCGFCIWLAMDYVKRWFGQ